MKRIKALGFIEVLIAIVVAGIVSAVFLSIAGNSMKDLIQTERIEYMARIAKDGANIAQEVANQEKANLDPTVDYFPVSTGQCYIPIRDEGSETIYKFATDESDNIIEIQDPQLYPIPKSPRDSIIFPFNNNSFGLEDNYFWGDNYFMVMCVDAIDTETSQWATVHFVVGDRDLAGQITNDSDVKDFIYYSVVEL